MQFRTKLLCILAVPVACLVTITVVAGSSRRSTADEMSGLRTRIEAVAAGVALADAAQHEQASSARLVASAGTDTGDLAQRRATTDAAAATWSRAVDAAGIGGSATFQGVVHQVRNLINALPVYRDAIDQGLNTSAFLESFENLSTSLGDLGESIAQTASDARVARETATIDALSDAKAAVATEWAAGVMAIAKGSVDPETDRPRIQNAVTARVQALGVYSGLASIDAAFDLRNTVVGDAVNATDSIERQLLATGAATSVTANPSEWWDSMTTRLGLMNDVLARRVTALQTRAANVQDSAASDFQRFVFLAGAAVLLSVLLGLVFARSVSGPLRKLTKAADRLATEQLPALVSGLKSPGEDDQRFLAATMQPLDVRSSDELGKLAEAFNTVQTVAVDVAAEQAQLLRKGISEIFVNLARRNQVLIDRQIEYLDDIEATEDDPDQLAQLYRLDHLATRMRRNAESLLVLAGHDPSRKRTRPVPLIDIVRAALAEVEDYHRIDITGFDEVDLVGSASVDLAHLMAELLENATHFSAPDTRVEVEGRRTRGGYLLSVIDRGVGMAPEQLDEANTLLATPPPVGLAIGRSLGFTVVARLSARYGTSVRLMAAPVGGVAAVVQLPTRLLAEEAEEQAVPTMPDMPAMPVMPPAPVAPPMTPPAPARPVRTPTPATVPVSSHAPLDRVIDAAWEADLHAYESAMPVPAVAPITPLSAPNGNGNGNGSTATMTRAGLTRRVPKGQPAAEETPSAPVPPPVPGVGASRRSPDDVRAMLARYRDGLERGRKEGFDEGSTR